MNRLTHSLFQTGRGRAITGLFIVLAGLVSWQLKHSSAPKQESSPSPAAAPVVTVASNAVTVAKPPENLRETNILSKTDPVAVSIARFNAAAVKSGMVLDLANLKGLPAVTQTKISRFVGADAGNGQTNYAKVAVPAANLYTTVLTEHASYIVAGSPQGVFPDQVTHMKLSGNDEFGAMRGFDRMLSASPGTITREYRLFSDPGKYPVTCSDQAAAGAVSNFVRALYPDGTYVFSREVKHGSIIGTPFKEYRYSTHFTPMEPYSTRQTAYLTIQVRTGGPDLAGTKDKCALVGYMRIGPLNLKDIKTPYGCKPTPAEINAVLGRYGPHYGPKSISQWHAKQQPLQVSTP